MKKLLFLILFLLLAELSYTQTSLVTQFKNPSDEFRPWTFWYWMRGAVSKEGIKADLEAMKDIGLGGAYLMPIKSVDGSDYAHPVSQLSPEWWQMVQYSMVQADRLGLKLGMHISDGFALAGGPWISPAQSMQKVVFSEKISKGGNITNLQLPQPETIQNYYEDIQILAIPINNKSIVTTNSPSTLERVGVRSNNPDDTIPFSIPDKDFRSEKTCYIQYTFKKPFTLRSIEITPAGNNIQSQRLTVLASNNGKNFILIKKLVPPRQGWQNTGFNTTFSIPPTKAKYFRLDWTPESSEPGSEDLDAGKWKPTLKIKAIRLSSNARINQWEGKSGLVWRIGEETTTTEIVDKECIPLNKIINLTSNFKDGKLNCKLPSGNWRILRMGHTSTGHTNATGGGGKGLECDKFSEKAVQMQFDNWFGAIFTKTDSALAHRVMKFMHIDSWECGSQNWSSNFADEFKKRRGYDLMPYFPLLAGYPVENIEKSEKVLRDVRTTIGELIDDVFFKVMMKNAQKHGCLVTAENVAPTMISDGMLHFKDVDFPMGEFWFRSPTHDKLNDVLDAISAGHIYDKNIIPSESFTELRTNWDEHPAMIKPLLDRNFALGINKIFFHIFVHNPYLDKTPGMTLDGIGLYFQRDQTWWKQAKSFVDYVNRCQTLLQYGKPVVDLAVFTGEEMPRRAWTPDKLVPYLPVIVDEKRVESEQKRLANVGQPMEETPVGVSHSANILKAEDWINPLNGYAYDCLNNDALIRLAKVENGKLVLSSGMSYSSFLFPSKDAKGNTIFYSDVVKEKVNVLKNNGVKIISEPVTINNKNAPALGISPDVVVPENIAWNHRKSDDCDIYFIANQEDKENEFTAEFRCTSSNISQWNAVTGEIFEVKKYKKTDNGMQIRLKLSPSEATFIVFGKKSITFEDFATSSVIKTDTIKTNWQIYFQKNQKLISTNKLIDWSKNEDNTIKYYSGTATYKTTFTWNFKSGQNYLYLNLGNVANLATVRINGVDCGTVWTAPYEVNISNVLKNGANSLEIDVTNTWANAINGADKGIPPFQGIWTNGKYRMKEDRLLEAGLFGPVTIVEKK